MLMNNSAVYHLAAAAWRRTNIIFAALRHSQGGPLNKLDLYGDLCHLLPLKCLISVHNFHTHPHFVSQYCQT